MPKLEEYEFKKGDKVAVIQTSHGKESPPEPKEVVRVTKRFIEVKDPKGRLSQYTPDGTDSYPLGRDAFRTYHYRLEPWTEEHRVTRICAIRRQRVTKYD